MIKYCRREGTTGYVTNATVLGCWNVIGLGILSGCIDAVVAGIASIAQYLRTIVIDKRVRKIVCVMAHGTIAGRVLMNRRGRCPSGAKPDKTAVMTRRAIARDTGMAEHRRRKPGDRVALIAVLGGWQVVCCLHQVGIGREELADMTTFAAIYDVLVNRKQKCRGRKRNRGIMADAALLLCRNVIHNLRRCDTGVMARGAVIRIYAQVVVGNARKGRKIVDHVT